MVLPAGPRHLAALLSLFIFGRVAVVEAAHHARIPVPVFREVYDGADLQKAIYEREAWSKTLEKQLENLTQTYSGRTLSGGEPFDTLGPQGPPCKKLEVIGAGNNVCGFYHFSRHEKGHCRVIVVGSGNEWSFEEAIYSETDCQIDTFDCTGPLGWAVPEKMRDRVRLHRKCLADREGKFNVTETDAREFITYGSALEIMGVTSHPSLMKIDVEGWEYEVFRSMLNTGGHDLPSQIVAQIHYRVPPEKSKGLPWAGRDRTLGELITFTDAMWRFGGYFHVYRAAAVGCEACTNVLLARHIGQSAEQIVHAAHDPAPGQAHKRHLSSKRADL